jgi:hypothetical protein
MDVAAADAPDPGGLSAPPGYQQVPLRRGILYVAEVPTEVELDDGVVQVVRRP